VEDGFENPWEPAEYTFSSISGSAGDDTFLLEGIENFYLNMMIVGTVGVDDIFPPDTYISFIDLDGGTFTTSAPALVAFTSEDLTVGNYFIAEWTGTPVTWYDVSQGVVHGFNGRIATTRSADDSFQECEFELKLIGGMVITDIDGDWIRSDTNAVVSSLTTITLADDAASSGVLNAEIPPDETIYSGMYLGNITFRISPYRNI
jgi:hypothetical protein